ncbi:hypothetical protein K470DRAFT_216995 [Piedraia hortae CBS 480.64]|uniref:CT20-domain-containing protein n=1 Tax=Piedraia hortae CBS 480.64 TaxID=1314780 RepID=A0A6A7BZE5_9PEZI|nr:hypothetical protein K470DRAFT_216995 [Piedraia hortae CBS 480.64]
MAPRKKPRVSTTEPPTPSQATLIYPTDAWTDSEEIGLLKGLVRFKPTGVHKHFHLTSLYSFMISHGYIQEENLHTRPEGIWEKLRTMYDLDALDKREDARLLSPIPAGSEGEDEEAERSDDDDSAYSEAENKIHCSEFEPPQDDEGLRAMMWNRRFVQEDEKDPRSSPPALPEVNLAPEPPVSFTPRLMSATPSRESSKAPAKEEKRTRQMRSSTAVTRSRKNDSDADEDEKKPTPRRKATTRSTRKRKR